MRFTRSIVSLLCLGAMAAVVLMSGSAASAADGWGNQKGRFVLDGKAPTPKPVNITKDQEFCGKHMLVDEEVVVGKDGGLQNLVLFLYVPRRGGKKPDVHPDYENPGKAIMDNENCRFEPRVITVRTGQTIELGNKDPVGHNMNIATIARGNTPFNQSIPANKSTEYSFNDEETLPVKVVCNVHPWMAGYIVVKDHPYSVVTDADGNFEIKNLPAGKWTFKAWQEKSGYVTKVAVDGKKTEWRRGEFEVEIKAGETTDLGTVKVDASNFNK